MTDANGEVFQHVEYFPFGETWVEEHSNRQRTPYLFTGKELDEDTQLYYFGARYYDPRTSVWQSPDPLLKAYLHGGPNGGVYEPLNLSLYSYARQHPVNFSDPNGEFWGAAAKLLKLAVKGGDMAATFAGAVADTQTIFSSDATIGERLLAAGSLATEIVSPVSARDAKAGYNAASNMIGGADDAADVARAVNRTDDAADISRQGTRQVDEATDAAAPQGRVLKDGEGATPSELADSVGGPTGGQRGTAQQQRRQELLDDADTNNGGEYECWRCGQTTTNPDNVHLGHRNVPTSKDGNLSPANTCLEGAACNLSAGNRGQVKPGSSCAERGSCGAPYGRDD